jgi:hypothetical protein
MGDCFNLNGTTIAEELDSSITGGRLGNGYIHRKIESLEN